MQSPYLRSFLTVIESSDCSEPKICSVIGFARCVLLKWRRQLEPPAELKACRRKQKQPKLTDHASCSRCSTNVELQKARLSPPNTQLLIPLYYINCIFNSIHKCVTESQIQIVYLTSSNNNNKKFFTKLLKPKYSWKYTG